MKKLVSIGMLLASSLAIAGQQVEVTGSGYSLEEARTDALEKALMKACKSAVVSNKVFRNRETERNKVIVYNGCLVKNYVVVDEDVDNLIRVTIKADVIQNHLPDRILSNSSEWFFYDFGNHKDRTIQLRMRMSNAKSLLKEVFLDYPYSAFNLERSEPYITYNGDQGYLNIDFRIYWNENFINALKDTFNILQDSKSTQFRPAKENIVIGRPYVSNFYGFTNHFITSYTFELLSNSRPTIRVRILDGHGKESVNVCYQLRRWYNLYDLNTMYWIKIHSGGVDSDRISIPIPEDINENTEIEMDVVTQGFCKQYVYLQ